MDVVRDFRRGAVRLHVLHHAAERMVNGAWMAAELAEHGYRISPGTLYPLLHDLEAAGLLVSEEQARDGRVTRCYAATAAGRSTLEASRAALSELAGELLPAPRPASRVGTGHSPGDLAGELVRLTDRFRSDLRDLLEEAR